MARYTAIAEGVASGTALKTILQVAVDANRQIAFYGLRISCKGTASADAPVRALVTRQTSAGTGGASLTSLYGPNKLDPGAPTSTVTCLKGPAGTWTAEPTAGEVVWAQEIHPQTGWGEYIPLGDEIVVAASGRLAVVVVAAVSVAVTAQLYWREGH
ncbi:hypothetical protein GCM10017673_56350 [Streptosporangium violaceochromogenes]|nr:hypothetical protein GCM10017673_56350 [Streptosporangium violaceochromogenes]